MADFTAGMGAGAYLQLSMQQAGAGPNVNWQLYLVQTSGYGSWNADPTGWSASINGVGYSGTYTYDFRGTSTKLIASGTTYVGGARSVYGQGNTAYTGSSIGGPTSVGGSIGVGQPPGAPGIKAAANGTTVAVTVTAPGDNGGFGITAYTLQWSNNGGATWQGTVSGGSHTYTNLNPGTYQFRAWATNAAGNGPSAYTGAIGVFGGGRLKVGGAWKQILAKQKVAGAWKNIVIKQKVGGAWKNVS